MGMAAREEPAKDEALLGYVSVHYTHDSWSQTAADKEEEEVIG
jgi:hypothetical protein